MKLSKTYEPQKYEAAIYEKWEKSGAFTPKIDWKKRPFVIPMPPPNVTGILHAGHASVLTYEDILARWHRLLGDPTLWYPGTDHAAIPTQEVVERKLWNEEKKTRHDFQREEFIEIVKNFAENSKKTILHQTRLMGASCDWTREKYTMDKTESRAVREIFVRMYQDGLIYRGNKIINWCPRCGSSLSNDEVAHKDIGGAFYFIKYHLTDKPQDFIEIATTRPETMFGDVAIAIHPQDKRWQGMAGKKVLIPIINREIPIIEDEYVDLETGSGGLKVTPAHDPNDFEIGIRHKLPQIVTIDKEGKMTKEAGPYQGMDRFECRIKLVEDLQKNGDLIDKKDHEHSVGHCDRCKTIIEPALSEQWFIDVQKKIPGRDKSLQEYCQDSVRSGRIKIIPPRFEAQYFNWVDNFRDWCISRQIWWGHQIPVWYCSCGEIIVQQEAPKKCPQCGSSKIKQDPDTLDTWFSSGLWTFGPHGWPEETEDLKYFTVPNAEVVLETGWEIITLWVVRMNLMTAYALNEIPFQTVYLNGMVTDKYGKKMSKSRPETAIDPQEVIEKYGTDALRMSLIIGCAPGNELPLSEEKIIGYRNFCNKLWNISRFILEREDFEKAESENNKPETLAQKWILSTLEDLKNHSQKKLMKFAFSPYGEALYDFLWNSFADWYLEIAKLEKNSTPILRECLRNFLILAHPAIPFVTEQIWQEGKFSNTMLISEAWPLFDKSKTDTVAQRDISRLFGIINSLRSARADFHIPAGNKINIMIEPGDNQQIFTDNIDIIKNLARVENIEFQEKPKEDHLSLISGPDTLYILSAGVIDKKAERSRLEKEIMETKKYQKSIKIKLDNKKFMENAQKTVIEKEQDKLKEVITKLEQLEKQLLSLG